MFSSIVVYAWWTLTRASKTIAWAFASRQFSSFGFLTLPYFYFMILQHTGGWMNFACCIARFNGMSKPLWWGQIVPMLINFAVVSLHAFIQTIQILIQKYKKKPKYNDMFWLSWTNVNAFIASFTIYFFCVFVSLTLLSWSWGTFFYPYH